MRNGNRHASEIARLSLELLSSTKRFAIPHMPNKKLLIRIGAHTGKMCTTSKLQILITRCQKVTYLYNKGIDLCKAPFQ